ncbi:hypothetical protein FQN51_007454 [Onygenales sp. PD_10]|nr:hypothetical protein FQN51_007454 [Onygenales sp. PD_10]
MRLPTASIYFYPPSLAASILFTALYALPTIFLLYTTLLAPRRANPIYRHARFFIPLCIGAVLEVAGYAVRIISIKKPANIPLYAVHSSLVVIAPVFICASLYLLVGRLVRAGLASESGGGGDDEGKKGRNQRIFGISPAWLPRIFVASDILSFLTQASGSGIASVGNFKGNMKEMGTDVLIGGLALQMVTFSVFLGIVGRFEYRAKQARGGVVEEGVRKVLIGIYVAGFFILVRCIYRFIEFVLGFDGYPFTHEWPLYVLEACPMLFALCVLGWYHPGRWLPEESGQDDGIPLQAIKRDSR